MSTRQEVLDFMIQGYQSVNQHIASAGEGMASQRMEENMIEEARNKPYIKSFSEDASEQESELSEINEEAKQATTADYQSSKRNKP